MLNRLIIERPALDSISGIEVIEDAHPPFYTMVPHPQLKDAPHIPLNLQLSSLALSSGIIQNPSLIICL
jgi:hypothetical protein